MNDMALALADHGGQDGLAAKKGPFQVDLQNLVPGLVGEIPHGMVGGDAGIVDQDIDAAMQEEDLLDGAFDLAGLGDIEGEGSDVGLGGSGRRVQVPAGDDCGGSESLDQGMSQAPGRAGDDDHLGGGKARHGAGGLGGRAHCPWIMEAATRPGK